MAKEAATAQAISGRALRVMRMGAPVVLRADRPTRAVDVAAGVAG
ncbi:hypothetical protein [Streptomyces spongiicola]|nr:hypothetical protein [Streptomyces spongiicola]